jgi:hypothetical protein
MLVIVVMIVTAVVVVVVAMIMSVIVPVVRAVCVAVVVPGTVVVNAPGVALLVIVVPVTAAISAGLRLERCLHGLKRRAQPLQHLLEHMVGCDAQEAISDLHRDMPVAQMVGRPGDVLWGLAGDVKHLLGLRHDFDYTAIACNDKVAAAQDVAARQHQRDLLAGSQVGAKPALLPRIERELELTLDLKAVGAAGNFQLGFYFDHQGSQKRK